METGNRVPVIVGAILGGGRSARFGSPKGLAEVGGRPILARILAEHRRVFPRTVLVADDPAVYASFGVTTIPDLVRGGGPVAGVQAALRWASGEGAAGICCTPCDAPFVKAELFEALVRSSDGADAVLPRSHGPLGYEPLFGLYSVAALPLLDAFLGSGGRAAHELVAALTKVSYLSLAAVERIGSPDSLFLNVNTPEDLRTARARESEGDVD